MFSKKLRELNDRWLALSLFACLISALLHPKSVILFGNIFLGFLLYKLVFEYSRETGFILFSVIIASVLNFIAQIFQLFNIRFIYDFAGLMRNPSHLGTYYALSIPIFYYFCPILIIIPIIGLLLTKTWTAVFAVILTIGYMFRKKIKALGSVWLMFFMSIIAVAITILHKQMFNDLYPRLLIWQETLKELTFLGHGFGFKMVRLNMFDLATNTYNVYLGIFYSLGILSIPVFIWLKRTLQIRNRLYPSILIIAIIGLAQSVMDFPRLAGTIIVLLALMKLKGGNV